MRVRKALNKLGFTLLLLIMLFVSPLTAQNVFAGHSLAADVISNNNGGNTVETLNGVLKTRTGYFCYLLTSEGGAVKENTGYALYSPGNDGLGKDNFLCVARKGGASTIKWFDVAPWGCTPWTDNGVTSNEPIIKQWFMTLESNGQPRGVTFVETMWGRDAAQKFINDEYILVVETMMNFQYSMNGGGAGGKGMSFKEAQNALALYIGSFDRYSLVIANRLYKDGEISDTVYDDWTRMKKANDKVGLEHQIGHIYEGLIYDIMAESSKQGSNYHHVGEPVTGTVPELVKYKQGLVGNDRTRLDSYVNGTAPASERIQVGGPGEKAGFVAYGGPVTGEIPNADILHYGVAMMVITANMDGQTTCDEPEQPATHEAPDESEGNMNIVKNYREEDLNTHKYTDLGCYVKNDVASNITVEDEQEFVVVGWKTTDSLGKPSSKNWETTVPGNRNQEGKKPTTVTLKGTDTTLYVLLERQKVKKDPVIPGDYTLEESQITRAVDLDTTDKGEDILKGYKNKNKRIV